VINTHEERISDSYDADCRGTLKKLANGGRTADAGRAGRLDCVSPRR
jgi:hypothetical protein